MEEDERSVTPIRSQAERDHSQSVSSSHLKKNPYCKFYEDSDSRQGTLMKVEFKSVSDSCIKELFGEDKAEREDQNEINKQKWEEDIIQEGRTINSTAQEREQLLRTEYEKVITNLRNGIHPTLSPLLLMQTQPKTCLTKLLCFQLNRKNSRHVIYDAELGTCVPSYPCQGCSKIFTKASALGGHIPKCPRRDLIEEHQKTAKKIQVFSSSSENGEEQLMTIKTRQISKVEQPRSYRLRQRKRNNSDTP